MQKKLFIIFIVLLVTFQAYTQGIIYVKPNNNSLNTGKNWNEAYNSINEALINSKAGNQIWVTQGFYLPTNKIDRNIAYEIKKGVKLYGGFIGNETSINQRNISLNKTTLSADIGVKNDSTDNSYNIIRCIDCDSTNLIDGFYLKNGAANNQEPLVDVYSNKKCGGAIYVDGTSINSNFPIISNCNFQNNSSSQYGGAIFFANLKDVAVTTILKNCSFVKNSSFAGGGIYIYDAFQKTSKNLIDSCYFEANTAQTGASIYFYLQNKTLAYSISNSAFKLNSAKLEGGAIYLESYGTEKGDIKIVNSQFDKNFALNGSSISCFTSNSNNKFTFENLAFTNHKSGNIVSFYPSNKEDVEIKHCIFKDNSVLRSIYGSNEKIINSTFLNNIDSAGITESQSNYSAKIYNSVFINNSNVFTCFGNDKQSAKLDAYNCLFYNNKQILSSGGYTSPFDPNKKNYIFSVGNFYNCIFQDNNKLDKEIFSGQSTINLFNCGIDTDSIGLYLRKKNLGGKISISGNSNITDKFIDANLHLLPCSPAINAGNNAYATGNTSDLDGKPRIAHKKIDIGPYEFQDFKINTYVTKPTFCTSKQGSFSPILKGNCSSLPTIAWENTQKQTGSGGEKLSAGVYTFFVKDTNGCADTLKNITIEDKGVISADFNIFNTSGTNAKNGSITVKNVNNGKAPFKYVWSNGDTTKTIQSLKAGDYNLTITDANGCVFSTTLTVKAASATSDIFLQNISIMPNPASDKITFSYDVSQFEKELFVTFYDLQGKVILAKQKIKNKEKIDISSLAKGLYFWQITDNQFFTKINKIVIQ